MTLTADTSVLIASFSMWHEHHKVALAATGRIDSVIAHCLMETYSVLTRMPAPQRMAADVVARHLDHSFGRHTVFALPPRELRTLVQTCAERGIQGGAVYDAVIAATCARANAKLLTLDARAKQTYVTLGTTHELLV